MSEPMSALIGGGVAAVLYGIDKLVAWRRGSSSQPTPLQGRATSMPDTPSLEFVVQQCASKLADLAAKVAENAADIAAIKRERSEDERRAETRRIVTEVARGLREELRGKRKAGGDGGERSSEG